MEQEVQLERLCTLLINVAFILLQWGKMQAVQKDYWYLSVPLILSFLKVTVQQTNDIVQSREGMVSDCLCPWDGRLSMVSWTKVPNKHPIAVFSPDFGITLNYRYKDRLEFLNTTHMDGSISLKNVTHQDLGLYHCSIQTFPQGPWTRNIEVVDLDEPPEDDSTEAPEKPENIVADRSMVEESSNSTISCKRPHNGTVYQVISEKMRDDLWFIIGICKKVEGGSVKEDYSDSGRVDCADSSDLSSQSINIASADDGFYRCVFNTDTGVQTTVVQLTITPPGGFSSSLYMMYIYIGAGAAGLALFIFFLILALRLRKKNRREEYRAKSHPTQRQPNIYENIPSCPRIVKKSKQTKSFPIYGNSPAGRSLQTRHQPQDKKRKGVS